MSPRDATTWPALIYRGLLRRRLTAFRAVLPSRRNRQDWRCVGSKEAVLIRGPQRPSLPTFAQLKGAADVARQYSQNASAAQLHTALHRQWNCAYPDSEPLRPNKGCCRQIRQNHGAAGADAPSIQGWRFANFDSAIKGKRVRRSDASNREHACRDRASL